MTSQEIQKKFKNQFGKIIELSRAEVDELSMLLIPEYTCPEFVCAAYTSDFRLDGYRFIKSKYITDIITCDINETLMFYNGIYKKEKILSSEKCRYRADNFRALFEQLLNSGEFVTVECNFDDAIDYYLGKITSVKSNIVTMKCFDGCGIFFKDEVKVNLDFVSMISIGDRYITVMSKYLKK